MVRTLLLMTSALHYLSKVLVSSVWVSRWTSKVVNNLGVIVLSTELLIIRSYVFLRLRYFCLCLVLLLLDKLLNLVILLSKLLELDPTVLVILIELQNSFLKLWFDQLFLIIGKSLVLCIEIVHFLLTKLNLLINGFSIFLELLASIQHLHKGILVLNLVCLSSWSLVNILLLMIHF